MIEKIVKIVCIILLALILFLNYKYVADTASLNMQIHQLSQENKFYNFDDTLRDCPLCTHEAKLLRATKSLYYIRCTNCGLETSGYDDIENAIKEWDSMGGLN